MKYYNANHESSIETLDRYSTRKYTTRKYAVTIYSIQPAPDHDWPCDGDEGWLSLWVEWCNTIDCLEQWDIVVNNGASSIGDETDSLLSEPIASSCSRVRLQVVCTGPEGFGDEVELGVLQGVVILENDTWGLSLFWRPTKVSSPFCGCCCFFSFLDNLAIGILETFPVYEHSHSSLIGNLKWDSHLSCCSKQQCSNIF